MSIQKLSGTVADADSSYSPFNAPHKKVYALRNDFLIETANVMVGVVPRYSNLEGTTTAPWG
ncbi:hypothetical protein AYO43_01340 [Nitrospira sp. SCGC AG-212-E16]|nr:hypothetical protein AYO43_01340 [Nitrospira sp. SCGC AG-212-E16]